MTKGGYCFIECSPTYQAMAVTEAVCTAVTDCQKLNIGREKWIIILSGTLITLSGPILIERYQTQSYFGLCLWIVIASLHIWLFIDAFKNRKNKVKMENKDGCVEKG